MKMKAIARFGKEFGSYKLGRSTVSNMRTGGYHP